MYIVTSIETSRTKHRTVRMAQIEANSRLRANHTGVAITRELPKGSYFRTVNVPIEQDPQKATFKQYLLAKSRLRTLGVSLDRTEHREYRVNVLGGREDSAYYATDLDDAVKTGEMMARANRTAMVVQELNQIADAILQMEPVKEDGGTR